MYVLVWMCSQLCFDFWMFVIVIVVDDVVYVEFGWYGFVDFVQE